MIKTIFNLNGTYKYNGLLILSLQVFNINLYFLVPNSPGGTSFEREVIPPDWVLDYWHPLEKAHYPEYFARRELRKKQFVEMWEKQYGKPTSEPGHH